ncbi:MAG TPA: hemerythrin domain-containing protein [Noviherbaspirillum sp.]|uniref:bacteriohemerythrin n=1 Tax=Noviherbaspirillum sp. TaxID=1926288 RepID=UPI002DDD25B1|nr:hemerythrin domain-containing protein [Noviherbaspirillum sp.]HEV2609844.1 hemerythrin domain-containing protein [Noviherbaspirillum sp.]
MPTSLWSPTLSVGMPSMDTSHGELLDKLACLLDVPDADFPAHYAAMVARVESDFREEEDLMEKIDFPGLHHHREQHCALLGKLHRVAGAIMQGDVALGRQTIAILPQWLVTHISTWDAGLAFALQFRHEEIL